MMQKNPVVYWELASHDAEKSIEFLKNVFDWEVEYDHQIGMYDIPAGESAKEFAGGGVFTLRKAKLPFLTIYIKVDDLEAYVKKIETHGGYIVEPPLQVANSKICLFNDPSGVTFAMIQPLHKRH